MEDHSTPKPRSQKQTNEATAEKHPEKNRKDSKKGEKKAERTKKKEEHGMTKHHHPVPKHMHPNRMYNFMQSMNKMFDEVICKGIQNSRYRDETFRYTVVKDHLDNLKENDPIIYKFYRNLMSQMVFAMFGTKMPTIKFTTYASNTINLGVDFTSTTGAIAFVMPLSASLLAGFGLFAAIFDEYIPTGPFWYTYYPRILGATGYPTSNTPAANGVAWAIGMLDYIDMSTAISQIPIGIFADTHKVFPLNPNGNTKHNGIVEWHGKFLGVPDLTWLNVTVISTNFVAFKAIQAQNVYGTGTIYWGYVTAGMEITFRQMTAI